MSDGWWNIPFVLHYLAGDVTRGGRVHADENSFLEQVLAAADVGLLVLTEAGEVVLANRKAAQLLRLPCRTAGLTLPAPGTTVADAAGHELTDGSLPWVRAVGDMAEQRADVEIRCDGHEPLRVTVHCVPLTDDGGAVIGVAVSVGERLSEQAADLSAAHEVGALLGQMPVGLIVVGPDRRIHYGNRAAARIWRVDRLHGVPARELYGATVLSGSGREYAPDELPVMRALRGETVHEEEVRITRHDGSEAYLLLSSAPIRDTAGRIRAGVCIALDVTERARADALNRAMAEITTVLDSVLEPEDIMSRVLGIAAHAAGAEGALLERPHAEGWKITSAHGYDEPLVGRELDREEAPIANWAMETGRPVAIPDTSLEPMLGGGLSRPGVRAVLAAPVHVRGSFVAVLILNFTRTGSVTPALVTFAERLSRAVSLALGNIALVESLRDELAFTKLLQEVAVVSTSSPDLRIVAARILKAIGRHMPMQAGDIRVLTPDEAALRLVAAVGYDDEMLTHAETTPLDGSNFVIQRAFDSGTMMTHEDDLHTEERRGELVRRGFDKSRYVLVPIDFRRRVVGTMTLAFEGRRAFTPEEEEVFRAVAHTVGQTIEASRLLEAEKDARRASLSELEVTNMLLEAAEKLAMPLELDEVLQATADSVCGVTGRSRVAVALYQQHSGQLVVRASTTGSQPIGTTRSIDRTSEAVRHALEHSRAIVVDASNAPLPPASRLLIDENGWSVGLIVPIRFHGQLIGIATVDEPNDDRPFSEREIRLAESVVSQAAVVIENARTYEAEHRIAETLQETLLLMPDHVPGIRFGTLYRSATAAARVGGDFFDLFETGENKVAIVVGDVSGKGLDAASVTALARNAVRIHATEGLPPSQVMEKTNDAIRRFTSLETFVTAFFGVLDVETGAFEYVCAGHPDGMLVGPGGYVHLLGGESPLLGALEGVSFPSRVTMVAPSDTIFLYTDGVTEARDPERRMYGAEQLRDFLCTLPDNDPLALPRHVFNEVEAFAGGMLRDDVALLAVRRERGGD